MSKLEVLITVKAVVGGTAIISSTDYINIHNGRNSVELKHEEVDEVIKALIAIQARRKELLGAV